MQRRQLANRHCSECKRKTKHERNVTAMGCGDLFMVLATCGTWLILSQLTKTWSCDRCGATSR